MGADTKTTHHFRGLMNYFLFDVDPENAELEAEKDACMVENKKRREENSKEKTASDQESGSDESGEEHDTHDDPIDDNDVIDLDELPP